MIRIPPKFEYTVIPVVLLTTIIGIAAFFNKTTNSILFFVGLIVVRIITLFTGSMTMFSFPNSNSNENLPWTTSVYAYTCLYFCTIIALSNNAIYNLAYVILGVGLWCIDIIWHSMYRYYTWREFGIASIIGGAIGFLWAMTIFKGHQCLGKNGPSSILF